MASLQLLALELSKAFVLYRQVMPEREEFELLVKTWNDVLADVNDSEFRESMRRVEARSSFFPVPADVMRQIEEARKRTPAVNLTALPEQTKTLDERCEEGAEWCAKILANLRGKMDARRQGRPDKPLNEQLANLRALGVEQ